VKTSVLYWCDHCTKQVAVTLHDVTEPSSEPLGETTWEAQIERRCTICGEAVADVEIITNRTGEYLKAHAKIEHEDWLPPGTSIEDFLRDGLSRIRLTCHATEEQIARIISMYSTDTHRVIGRIEMTPRRSPFITFHHERRREGLNALLAHDSDIPLSSLARRQAS